MFINEGGQPFCLSTLDLEENLEEPRVPTLQKEICRRLTWQPLGIEVTLDVRSCGCNMCLQHVYEQDRQVATAASRTM